MGEGDDKTLVAQRDLIAGLKFFSLLGFNGAVAQYFAIGNCPLGFAARGGKSAKLYELAKLNGKFTHRDGARWDPVGFHVG